LIKHFLNPPNWFTSASIFCSTYAMLLVTSAPEPTPELLSRACVLVIFGGIFDLLDGRVAKITNRFTSFGAQLDSIADIVGFGVAPAVIAYAWMLQDLGAAGVAIAFWYVLTTAFRLARYNVNADEKTWPLRGHSQGLTSTMAGGCLVTLIWVSNGYMAETLVMPAWAVGAFVTILGLLMVSSIPFRDFRDLRRNHVARRWLAVALSACLAGAVVLDPSMWWGVGGALYLLLGTADGLVVAVHQRILSRALLIDEILEEMDAIDVMEEQDPTGEFELAHNDP
jgi:CDP-diacylglycerol--serine O-phosphatidyltransferase